MRAGDRDQSLPVDEPGERLRTMQHRDAAAQRLLVLRVVLPEGARDDEGVGVADVGGVVPDRDLGAQLAQLAHGLGVAQIRAGDPVTRLEEQPRDAAHARAADADEVRRRRVRRAAPWSRSGLIIRTTLPAHVTGRAVAGGEHQVDHPVGAVAHADGAIRAAMSAIRARSRSSDRQLASRPTRA